MFCSENCKQEHTRLSRREIIVDTYRTSAKCISSLETFYRHLSQKEKFCVICGKELILKQDKATNKIIGVILMFATIVPGALVAISSKPNLPVLTSLMKQSGT